jgi:hypothetical protein
MGQIWVGRDAWAGQVKSPAGGTNETAALNSTHKEAAAFGEHLLKTLG